jgi:hypothetical protein
MAPCRRVWRCRLCPNGKKRRWKEIASRSRVSSRHCRASFHRPFCLGRSAAHSCRRRRGWRSIHIGGRIHFAPIAWRVRLLPAAERLEWLELEARPRPQERITSHNPNATCALSRTRIRARSRILLRLRATGLSLRLACRSVGHRRQQEYGLALRLRDRMAILECAEWPGPAAAAPARATLRRNWRAAVEERRG